MTWCADNALKERYILSMIRKSPFFIAFCLNVLFFLLYLFLGQVKHGSLDDYFMSSVLTGAYGGEYDVHMYFVNAAYGYFLKPFYWLFPKVGWYFIFELVGTFAAFTAYTYVLIKKMRARYGVPLSLLMLASLTPDFYFQLSFTQCATAYTAAGILLVSVGLSKENRWLLVLGGLGLLAGSFMRWKGFLLGMPYLCYLFALVWHEKRSFGKKSVVVLGMIFVAIAGLHYNDRSLYTEREYKQYAAYQPVRAYFGDGAFYDSESTFDELEERGLSGKDLYTLQSWTFYDTDVFAIDSLKPIIKISQNNLYSPNPVRMPVTFLMSVSRALMRSSGWCWAIFCLFLMLTLSRKANLYPWVSLSFVAISIGYLLLVNRLVYHVESGIWLYAIVCSIVFMSQDKFSQNLAIKKWNRIIPVILVLMSAYFAYFSMVEQVYIKDKKNLIETVEVPKNWQMFLDYAHDHPNDVFILSFGRYKSLGTIHNPPYLTIEPGSWNNIFSWGYWNIYLPAMVSEFQKRGVTNPIKDIVRDNVYTLENNNRPSLDDFYKQHYHKTLGVDTVKTFGDLMLLKYHVVEDTLENGEK